MVAATAPANFLLASLTIFLPAYRKVKVDLPTAGSK